MPNENLFEGIQIMTPEETESIASETIGSPGGEATPPVIENDDNTENPPKPTDEDGLVIAPVGNEAIVEDTIVDVPTDTTGNISAYAALIKDMITDGIFSEPEEEELKTLLEKADGNAVKELMQKTLENNLNSKQDNWRKGFTGAKKRFLEIEDSFDDTDRAIEVAKELAFYEGLDEESIKNNPKLMKQLYYTDLINKGFTKEDAAEAVQDAEAVDKILDKAMKSLPSLKANSQSIVEAAKVAKEEEQKAFAEEQKQTFDTIIGGIDAKEEFIPGMKLNKRIKDKIKSNITDIVHTDELGNKYTSLMHKQKTDPVGFQQLISYYDSLGLFNMEKTGGFKPDISKIKRTVKSAATSELDKVLKRGNDNSLGNGNSDISEKSQGIFDILEGAYGK